MNDNLKKIRYFAGLFEDIGSTDEHKRKEVENRLLKKVNNLGSVELKFLSEYYQHPYYVDLINKFNEGILGKDDKGGVSVLRYNLLQYLLNNKNLTSEIIDLEKRRIRDIVNKYEKNYDPFHSWPNQRVLYSFCFNFYKDDIYYYLEWFANELRKQLNIFGETKIRIVTFDGSQNQGYDHCWIAIYDKRFKSQKETKQIYVGFLEDLIYFDIYEHETKIWGLNSEEPRGECNYEDFSIKKMFDFFKDKKDDIFDLSLLKSDLDKAMESFRENKQFTEEEINKINDRIYSEESTFNTQSQTIIKTNHHYKIYELLKTFLNTEYGTYAFEKLNIDITATKNNDLYIFEIKPFDDPKHTIRNALGQLIEYYYSGNKKARYLCIVGISPLNDTQTYFKYLKDIFKDEMFELRYYYVDYENKRLIEDK